MTDVPERIVENGRPIFGSFNSHVSRLDIRGVRKPFGVLPLPTFITNMRIRSNLSYAFKYNTILGSIDILDAKFFGFAEVILWDLRTGKKFAYRTLMGPRRRFIPKNLESAICATFKKKRYIRISWNRKAGKLSLLFNLAGDGIRPDVNVALTASINQENATEFTSVMPAPGIRRCTASYVLGAPIQGSISLLSADTARSEQSGYMLFNIRRAYYKLRTKSEFLLAMGMYQNHQIAFSITTSSISANDSYTYNENALFVDGVITPLPPVTITFPFGINNKWIIQDTESMVDLSFTPISDTLRIDSAFVVRTQYHTMYGSYNGVLLTANGEKIQLKDFPGIAKKHLLRL